MTPEEQRKKNLRLAWTLAVVVAVLFLGAIVRWGVMGN